MGSSQIFQIVESLTGSDSQRKGTKAVCVRGKHESVWPLTERHKQESRLCKSQVDLFLLSSPAAHCSLLWKQMLYGGQLEQTVPTRSCPSFSLSAHAALWYGGGSE